MKKSYKYENEEQTPLQHIKQSLKAHFYDVRELRGQPEQCYRLSYIPPPSPPTLGQVFWYLLPKCTYSLPQRRVATNLVVGHRGVENSVRGCFCQIEQLNFGHAASLCGVSRYHVIQCKVLLLQPTMLPATTV